MTSRIICVVLIAICSLGWTQKSTAQIVDLKHAAYVELGGTAGMWSVNYDLMALNINNFKIGARVGFGFLTEGYEGTTIDLHIPLTANFMYAIHKGHHVELSIGTQIASYEIRSIKSPTEIGWTRKTEALGNYSIGYRFQSPDGGFVFRASYSPFFYQDGIYFRHEHWAGVSLGYAFNKGGKNSTKSTTE